MTDTTDDAVYRRHLERRTARAAYIEAQRSEDPTWNGTGVPAPATQYEKRRGVLRGRKKSRPNLRRGGFARR